MGASTFTTTSKGKDALDAFRKAVSEARYDYGNNGYTGTIAEKDSFVMIDLPEGKEPREYAFYLIDADDSRIYRKWGPAGCFDLGKGDYFFFGWASE